MGRDIRHLQRELNEFTKRFPKLDLIPLRIDGEKGQLTKKRLHAVQFYLGYKRENLDEPANEIFYERANHPFRIEPSWNQTKDAVRRGKKRRKQRRRAVRYNKVRAYLKPGVGTFDGKPVAKCAIPILNWCRQNGWDGHVVSGWRDPNYSRSLCIRMCGSSSCPGRCAGMASNHVGNSPSKFALDVSDYANFERVVARCPLQPKIRNELDARDPVHFSPSGN